MFILIGVFFICLKSLKHCTILMFLVPSEMPALWQRLVGQHLAEPEPGIPHHLTRTAAGASDYALNRLS